jgi:hypothetical protein
MRYFALNHTSSVVIVEVSNDEFEFEGWPLKPEKVKQMIASGDLVEFDEEPA